LFLGCGLQQSTKTTFLGCLRSLRGLSQLPKRDLHRSNHNFPIKTNKKSAVFKHQGGKLAGGHAVKLVGWGEEGGVPYWFVSLRFSKK
jgi:hypothetical protein